MIQPHLKCKERDVEKYALLPGDPSRVERITKYLEDVRKISLNREFLTYTGKYKGIPVTVTSTGIGCPSAAIAIEELANLGAEVFIRVGTCGSLQKEINVGDLIIPFAAMRSEGTTKEYVQPEFPALADLDVFNALIKAAKTLNLKFFTGVNRTHDAFYEAKENFLELNKIKSKKLVSSEMECSTIFLLPMIKNLKGGAILTVATFEPLEEVAKNPELVYELIGKESVDEGIENSIKIALEAVNILEKDYNK